jgi:Flp pilus assembly protein TadG
MKRLWLNYCRNTQGNFAIMFSVAVGMIILGVAVAIEVSRMHGQRAALQDMADSAALSGAYIAKTDINGREATVRENIKFHQAFVADEGLATNAVVTFDDETEQVTVTIPRTFPSFFSGIIGQDDLEVVASTTVSYKSEAIDPVTIAFALDVSGSMRENTELGARKIDVLKQSTKLLFDELEGASERPDLLSQAVRTGMTSYNTDVASTQPIQWGWQHLESSVDALNAEGGTNSTPALQSAYDQLVYDRPSRESDPKFQMNKLREYVIFMTDGDNNEVIADEDSAKLCKKMREEGVEIYSIGFTAPEKGQLLLLDCASWNSGDEPEDMSEYEDDDVGNSENDDDKTDPCDQGNGKKKGRCKKQDDKSKYYFDAEDAEAFKNAFATIGKEIAQNTIRITG